MLGQKMQDALNAQVNAEYYSSYLYLAMAAYFEAENLRGFANWMRVQAQEEHMHAMKFYNFILQRNGKVTLKAIEAPPATWESPLALFENAYKHEQHVTSLINGLVNLALAEADHASNTFLQWFVNEQVEEEANADAVIQDLKRVGNASPGLFLMDRELATRTVGPDVAAAGGAGTGAGAGA
jgi:ferritin